MTAIDERQWVSDVRRAEIENEDLRRQVASQRETIRDLKRKVDGRLTPAQAKDVLAENHELRNMNQILLARNTVLARDARKT